MHQDYLFSAYLIVLNSTLATFFFKIINARVLCLIQTKALSIFYLYSTEYESNTGNVSNKHIKHNLETTIWNIDKLV